MACISSTGSPFQLVGALPPSKVSAWATTQLSTRCKRERLEQRVQAACLVQRRPRRQARTRFVRRLRPLPLGSGKAGPDVGQLKSSPFLFRVQSITRLGVQRLLFRQRTLQDVKALAHRRRRRGGRRLDRKRRLLNRSAERDLASRRMREQRLQQGRLAPACSHGEAIEVAALEAARGGEQDVYSSRVTCEGRPVY
eukprot:6193474-Pleurochrysis_carterae.AAC.4